MRNLWKLPRNSGIKKQLAQIYAYGIRTPSVSFDFKSTKEKGIWGNKRDLLFIVRTPKVSTLKCRFLLDDKAVVAIGKLLKIHLAQREDVVLDIDYRLLV